MTPTADPALLHAVALLHLVVAHGADQYLSDSELRVIIDTFNERYGPVLDEAGVRDLVLEAMTTYQEAADPEAHSARAVVDLAERLPLEERRAVLDGLRRVAAADGVVVEGERGFLDHLARVWGLDAPALPPPPPPAPTTLLDDLALLFVVLAHGTDHDLSEQEQRVIRQKLQEWHSAATDDVERVLRRATERYALGPDEQALAAAIRSVKAALPEAERAAVLQNLVQIANADGIFLDNEEDMINHMLHAWELHAGANYSARSSGA